MSKANQKFVQADEAVSPVIGVILMVAITVVLAAVVFVLVSNLGKGSESAPTLAFTKSGATLTLTKAEAGVTWDEFSFNVVCPGTPALTVDGAAVVLASGVGTGGATAVDAGDTVVVDDTVTTGAVTCTLTITHVATNSLVYGPTELAFTS